MSSDEISKDEVKKIAKLSQLSLSDSEAASFTSELNAILEYVRHLDTVDVTHLEAMSHVSTVTNVFRTDEPNGAELSSEDALRNAPDRSGRFFRVPLVIEG